MDSAFVEATWARYKSHSGPNRKTNMTDANIAVPNKDSRKPYLIHPLINISIAMKNQKDIKNPIIKYKMIGRRIAFSHSP
jgi:hypothetical protein